MHLRMFRRVMSVGVLGVVMGVAVVVAALSGVFAFAQERADVSGDWMLTVQTDNGTTTPSVSLEQNGSELTGHYSSEALGEADVTGTIDGNGLRFSLQASLQGVSLEVVYMGTVEADGTLSGRIALGDLGGGTFTGTRR